MSVSELPLPRISRAKCAFTTRRMDLPAVQGLSLLAGDVVPHPGDLVLAEVTVIGQHKRVELATGRRASLYIGDEVVLAYAGRYAPDQFEAEVPPDLSACQLVAGGGLAARVVTQHADMDAATELMPVGLIADSRGRVLNVRDGALAPRPARSRRSINPMTIVVAGTSMNSGKTTTVAAIAHGLTALGLRVGAMKVTGTGAGGDPFLFADAGAAEVLDFTDAGYASTYRVPVGELAEAFITLHEELAARGVDAIVVEIADGILQQETAALLREPVIAQRTGGMVFAAGDALGAVIGVTRLRELGLPVLAASGILTCSPLAVREAQSILDVPVYSPEDLGDTAIAQSLLDRIGLVPDVDRIGLVPDVDRIGPVPDRLKVSA